MSCLFPLIRKGAEGEKISWRCLCVYVCSWVRCPSTPTSTFPFHDLFTCISVLPQSRSILRNNSLSPACSLPCKWTQGTLISQEEVSQCWHVQEGGSFRQVEVWPPRVKCFCSSSRGQNILPKCPEFSPAFVSPFTPLPKKCKVNVKCCAVLSV